MSILAYSKNVTEGESKNPFSSGGSLQSSLPGSASQIETFLRLHFRAQGIDLEMPVWAQMEA